MILQRQEAGREGMGQSNNDRRSQTLPHEPSPHTAHSSLQMIMRMDAPHLTSMQFSWPVWEVAVCRKSTPAVGLGKCLWN